MAGKTKTRSALLAMGGIAAAGAGAAPAQAMLPAEGGSPPPTADDAPETGVRTGHPTHGQVRDVPAREVTPPEDPPPAGDGGGSSGPARGNGGNGDGGGNATPPSGGNGPLTPATTEPKVRIGHPTRGQEVPRGGAGTGNGTAGPRDRGPDTPEPAADGTPDPASDGTPDPAADGTPDQQKRLRENADRYASALDQIDANGGALNPGLARTVTELGGRERVTKLAKEIRETRAGDHGSVEDGDVVADPQPGRYGLTRDSEPRGPGSALNDLRQRYPHADLDDVLADGNRKTRGLPDENDALEGVDDPRGYQLDEGDTETEHWHPQGVDGGPGYQIISSYGQPGGDGPGGGEDDGRGRISVVNTETGTYRHVLLVQPTGGGEFDQVETHAGGVVVRGERVYVAQTDGGVDVFNTNRMVRVDDDERDADGYKYLLPKVATYRSTGEDMRFSTLSIDDSGPGRPALVVGEYNDDPDGTTRVVRWNLDANGAPEENASAAYVAGRTHVQGVAMKNGKFFMASSASDEPNPSTGELYSGYAGSGGLHTTHPWSDGVESLDVDGDRLWTVTEHPGKRLIVNTPLSAFD